ncbi:MAG TPA: site-2 protease family protein [Candidatus Dormibacteraeota bacterium]|jgi:Zn-dependent protease
MERWQIYLSFVLYTLPGLVMGFTFHELAHAVVAVRYGDSTPRAQGRISLDPRKHIDPLGFGLLLTVGFGWAKPVQFNPYVVRTRVQQGVVAAAGPLTNLFLAVVFLAAMHLQILSDPQLPGEAGGINQQFGHGGGSVILYWFLMQGFFINVVLFVFNMLPIPGIDGYMVFRGLLGGVIPGVFDWMDQNRQVVWFAAIGLLFLLPQLFGGTVNPLASLFTNLQDFLYRTFVTPDYLPAGGFVSLFNVLSSG